MKHRVWIVFLFSLVVCVACQHSVKEDMRLRLDYVSKCNRADTVFTEAWLPRVDSLVSYFDRHGNVNERMMAHYLQGRVYHDMGEAPQALECYLHATEQADTTREDCDIRTLSSIYGQEAILFHMHYLPSDELKAYINYQRFRWKMGDTLQAIKGYELRTRPYYLMNDTDSVLSVAIKARQLYLKYGSRKDAASVLPTIISIYLDRHQYDSAFVSMQEFEKWSGRFDKNGELIGNGVYYYDKGRYALAKGKIDSAQIYFYKTLHRGFKEAGYKGLLSLYEKIEEKDSVLKYARQYADANDYSYLHTNQSLLHSISAMHDYNRQQRVAKEKSAEALFNMTWALIGTLISIVAVLLLCGLWLAFQKKRKKIRFLQEAIEKDTIALNDLTKEVSLLKKTISQNQLSVESNPYYITYNLHVLLKTKEREIKILNNRLKYYQHEKDGFVDKHQNSDLIGQGDICIILRKYLKDVKQHPTNGEWKSLIEYVEISLPYFKSIIFQKGSITDNQYILCCLVRAGFSPSEIHVLMNMSKENVSATRKRLLKKILGIEGKPKDFDQFILGIK